jgi:SAM-dependent methyltransferase
MELLKDDVPFYTDLAAASRGKPVLELGCGTGRVLLPLAREAAAGRGASIVVGVDRSAEMLRVAAGKLAEEPLAVRERVRLVRADMAELGFAGRFGLAIVAFRSLVNLADQAAQIAALRSIRDALEPGGRAIVDLFFPDLGYLAVGIAEPREVAGYEERATGCRLRFTHHARLDPVRQTIDDALEEERTWPDGRVERRTRRYRLRFPFCEEMRLMASVAGLDVEGVFGWFDRRPLDADAREMIFLLRRPA